MTARAGHYEGGLSGAGSSQLRGRCGSSFQFRRKADVANDVGAPNVLGRKPDSGRPRSRRAQRAEMLSPRLARHDLSPLPRDAVAAPAGRRLMDRKAEHVDHVFLPVILPKLRQTGRGFGLGLFPIFNSAAVLRERVGVRCGGRVRSSPVLGRRPIRFRRKPEVAGSSCCNACTAGDTRGLRSEPLRTIRPRHTYPHRGQYLAERLPVLTHTSPPFQFRDARHLSAKTRRGVLRKLTAPVPSLTNMAKDDFGCLKKKGREL